MKTFLINQSSSLSKCIDCDIIKSKEKSDLTNELIWKVINRISDTKISWNTTVSTMGSVRFIRFVATLNTLTIVYLHMQVKKSLRQHVHTPRLCERDIYMPHLVRVIVARSASAFNEPRRISTTKERDKQRSHSTGSHGVSFKKIHQRKQDGIPSPSGACPNHGTCAYTHTHIYIHTHTWTRVHADATVMYKVLRRG